MAIDTFSIPMPQAKFPGIVHVAPAVIGEDLHPITCINVSDILIRHRAYWRERGVDLSEPSASKRRTKTITVLVGLQRPPTLRRNLKAIQRMQRAKQMG
jgi:hypothetical protein